MKKNLRVCLIGGILLVIGILMFPISMFFLNFPSTIPYYTMIEYTLIIIGLLMVSYWLFSGKNRK